MEGCVQIGASFFLHIYSMFMCDREYSKPLKIFDLWLSECYFKGADHTYAEPPYMQAIRGISSVCVFGQKVKIHI